MAEKRRGGHGGAGKGTGKGAREGRRTAETRAPGPVGRAVRRLVLGLLRLGWALAWRLGLVGGLVLGAAVFWFYSQLPPADTLFDGRGGGSVTMLDRNGNVFAWRGEQYGGDLRATEVSPFLVHAVVATEDRRFWWDPGIDPIGLLRALVINIRAGHVVEGGSTLTQQVAKNVFLTSERTISRKLKEVPMAFALELKYTKEQILSIYLNRVYLGSGCYGFEAASQRYFGKSARLLDPAESAMLAGLLRAPSRYAPTTDLAAAQGRADVIVRLMEDQGYLTEAQTVDALAHPAVLSQAAASKAGGYFADWVMETAPAFLSSTTTEDVTMSTTFEPAIQTDAEDAVREVFDQKVRDGSKAQAAVVVMSRDGAVRAIVGGRGTGVGQFDRATQALRQPGSSFKPVVYAAALQAGLSPDDVMQDAPITVDGWSPSNFENTFRGPVTLTTALAESINTVAVRVAERIGRARVRAMAKALGMTHDIDPGPASTLGTSETTLMEMTGVYATIANDGRKSPGYGIRSIRLRGDNLPLMVSDSGGGAGAMNPDAAKKLVWMMEHVVTEGTARRAALPGREVAGKTGTTQNSRDAWFIGFTADYVVGVWMGNDDNQPLKGTVGGTLPADIFKAVMTRIEQGLPPRPLDAEPPSGASSGLVAQAGGRPPVTEASASGGDTVVQQVFRNVLSGLLGDRDDTRAPKGREFRPYSADH